MLAHTITLNEAILNEKGDVRDAMNALNNAESLFNDAQNRINAMR